METSLTMGNLLSRSRASRTVKSVLRNCLPDLGKSGHPVTILSFLRSAALGEESSVLDARSLAKRLFVQGFTRDDVLELFSTSSKKAGPSASVTPGLAQAFDEVQDLRARVGGQDEYFGLRHLIFAILSSTEPPLASEVDEALDILGIDRRWVMGETALFVLDNLEPQERENVWREIFAERNVVIAGDEGVAISLPDDPWAPGTRDRSGARREAKAFAEMVMASTFEPPLAVGVFGDWGSGKSFFLRLMYYEVERLKERAPGECDEKLTISFLKNVEQIRFNAWHYAETNLWASLVAHIFTTLDARSREHCSAAGEVLDRLSSARTLTVEAASELIDRRRDVARAEKTKDEAVSAVEDARSAAEKSPASALEAAWSSVIDTPEVRVEIERAAGALGIGAAAERAESFRNELRELDGETRGRAIWRTGILHAVTRPAFLAVLLGGGLVAALTFNRIGAFLGDSSTEILATAGSIVAWVTGALGLAARKTGEAVATLRNYRIRFEQAVGRRTAAQNEEAARAAAALAAAEAEAAKAEEKLEIARERAAEVSRDYRAQTGGERIAHFVRDRISSGDYAGQLGFIATIRKDFEELSLLMKRQDTAQARAAREALAAHGERIEKLIERAGPLLTEEEIAKLKGSAAATQPAKGFERIILYIDDLDRCAPPKVVEVLQAIHLLLAFPLFIVFVAVDVRWLRHALETHYSGQIGSAGGASATAGDYLEKIFQIPYWVRPLAGPTTVAILRDHMQEDVEANLLFADDQGRNPAVRNAGEDDSAAIQRESWKSTSDEPPAGTRLRLCREEAEFIEAIGMHLDGSPRRTLRFINAYRLIKASLGRDEIGMVERRDHRALLSLLTISIAADSAFPLVAAELRTGRRTRNWTDATESDRRIARQVMDALDRPSDLPALKRYAPLVERFSFHPPLPGPGESPGP